MSIPNIIAGWRGTGCWMNLPDGRDWDFAKLSLPSAKLPTSHSLAGLVTNVCDQRSTNSCVANAIAGGVDVLESAAGLASVPVSRLFIYYNARRLHGAQRFDSGTYIRLAIKGLVKLGVPDEQYWKFSVNPLRINRRPGWQPSMMAHPRRGGEYYSIFSEGKARTTAIKAAIVAGYPVVFGTPVSRQFMNNQGPRIIDRPTDVVGESIVGRHAMLIVGYEHDDFYGTVFEVLNSWGTDWKDGGFCKLSEDYVRWDLTRDLTILHGWDRLRKASEVS